MLVHSIYNMNVMKSKFSDFNRFSNLYSLLKTLRFSLIPIGQTLKNIETSHLLDQDAERAVNYRKVKDLIDEYHKYFIETALGNFSLGREKLEEYDRYYNLSAKDEEQKKHFDDVQTQLRKQISNHLKNDKGFNSLFSKEIIEELLPKFLKTEADRSLVDGFKKFTTYFKGFHENRKNLYTEEAQPTAISYRLIHDNLPRFIDNIKCFNVFKAAGLVGELTALYASLKVEPGVATIDEMFQLNYYNKLLTERYIDIYNVVIGGKTVGESFKVKGLNELVNLYNQQQKDKNRRIPLFKPLLKQILSDRNTISWLPEQITEDNEALDSIKKYYVELEVNVLNSRTQERLSLRQLLMDLRNYDLKKIYVDYAMLPAISQQVYASWSFIYRALDVSFMENHPMKKGETVEKYEERRDRYFKNKGAYSVAEVEEALSAQSVADGGRFVDYFTCLGVGSGDGKATDDLFERVVTEYAEVKSLLDSPYPDGKKLVQDKENVEKLKNLLDSIKALQHFISPLTSAVGQADKDERFYGQLIPLWSVLEKITPLYNKVRNYLTRKPYSVEKIKLNFENSTLMNGWDVNKIRDNTTVILRKDGEYFLAIMDKKHNKIFDAKNIQTDGECYEKMDYKLLPGPNKMLPKVFFSTTRESEFNPSDHIKKIRENGSFKKGNKFFSIEDCHTLIDYYKACLSKHKDWKKFNFQFSETKTYKDISDFYREVETQGYMVSFSKIATSYINRMVNEGKLYLFKIYNKDFSPYSSGTPNLHTIYWKLLFDPRNLSNVVYELKGEAEVFYRKASLSYDRPTHPANQPIANKRENAVKKESVFAYDLVKDRRYTVDHFQLHVPIMLNFKSQRVTDINQMVNDYIQAADDLYIIGIDRGERNLLYLSLIDLHGHIVDGKQFSLNFVNGTDYHALLEKRECERQDARRSWQTIESIKELKEGYLSQVVRVVTDMMTRYHAIVVLENLNSGFKRGRQKVERQVYQKFEKMLIDKLNYWVDKKRTADEPGGALKAYQLTNPFVSFEKIGRQNGFLFYVPAWNTSKIDPVTGFVNLFDTRYESVAKSQAFFAKFNSISYNHGAGLFEFAFHYSNFTGKGEGTRDDWTICSYGERIEKYQNKAGYWNTRNICLTEELKKLFECYGVSLDQDLKDAVCRQNKKGFFYNDQHDGGAPLGLMQLFKLMLQMRNSEPHTNIDYLISPVADERGHFYDSREAGDDLPKDADANGAYNIARKGLWYVRKIKENGSLMDMKLTNKEWLKFAQEKPYEK